MSTSAESSRSAEALGPAGAAPRPTVGHDGTTRIDAAHGMAPGANSGKPDPSLPETPDDPPAAQLRLQSAQLAAHFRGRQKELDHREAELNSWMARLESDARTARLWLSERESELAARDAEAARAKQQADELAASLSDRERLVAEAEEHLAAQWTAIAEERREAEKRLARLASAEAAFQKQAEAWAAEKQCSAATQPSVEALSGQKLQLDETEARLAKAQDETQRLCEELAAERRAFAEEMAATRQRMDAEHAQAMADVDQKRQAVQRRSDHIDHARAAMKQLRSELANLHRETLEIRLATEELWVQLSGAAPPAALTRSLGRIRTKLAAQYRQANAELAEERKELDAIRAQLCEQHAAAVEQRRRFEEWANGRQEECERQASRLVAREHELHQEEIRIRQDAQRWQAERLKLEQDLRRLRARLAVRHELAASL